MGADAPCAVLVLGIEFRQRNRLNGTVETLGFAWICDVSADDGGPIYTVNVFKEDWTYLVTKPNTVV